MTWTTSSSHIVQKRLLITSTTNTIKLMQVLRSQWRQHHQKNQHRKLTRRDRTHDDGCGTNLNIQFTCCRPRMFHKSSLCVLLGRSRNAAPLSVWISVSSPIRSPSAVYGFLRWRFLCVSSSRSLCSVVVGGEGGSFCRGDGFWGRDLAVGLHREALHGVCSLLHWFRLLWNTNRKWSLDSTNSCAAASRERSYFHSHRRVSDICAITKAPKRSSSIGWTRGFNVHQCEPELSSSCQVDPALVTQDLNPGRSLHDIGGKFTSRYF